MLLGSIADAQSRETQGANRENNVVLSEFIFILIISSGFSGEEMLTLLTIRLYSLAKPWKTDRKGKISKSLSCSATTTEPSK